MPGGRKKGAPTSLKTRSKVMTLRSVSDLANVSTRPEAPKAKKKQSVHYTRFQKRYFLFFKESQAAGEIPPRIG
jgi:hypothetical protein